MTMAKTDPNYDTLLDEKAMTLEPSEPSQWTPDELRAFEWERQRHEAKRAISMPVPQSNTIAIFERMVRDPSISLDRIERVIAMLREQEALEAAGHFSNMMARAQADMTRISRDGANPETKSRYATLAAVDQAIRPIYSGLGFSIQFDTARPIDKDNLITVIAHISLDKYTRTLQVDVGCDGLGPKGTPMQTKTHAIMSAITYGRRALLKMAFNLAETDDDGNAAGNAAGNGAGKTVAAQFINDEQERTLLRLLKDKGRSLEKFCQYERIEALPFMLASRYDSAVNMIKGLK